MTPTEPDRRPLDYETPRKLPNVQVPGYRKIVAGVMIAIGIAIAVAAMFQVNPSARLNFLTAAAAFAIWGVVILFQHVRL